jgi:CRISPR-associated protein Csx14
MSPAVVTETTDALLDEGINLKRVYIVTTLSEDVQSKCIPLLVEEFQNNPRYRGLQLFSHEGIISRADIIDESDNTEFMTIVANIMKREKSREADIYLGMAGGRKTMSAAIALLAQIYTAKATVHVLVPPEIEEKGRIDRLEKLSAEERKRVLHPDKDIRRLILFPVIGISWMLDEMIGCLKGKTPTDENVLKTLRLNGLVDASGKPTNMGQKLLDILEDIESFPPPSFTPPDEKYRITHPPHMPKGTDEFIKKLARNPWVTEIRSIEFVDSSETRILRAESDGKLVCQYSDGSKAVKLLLSTTAATKGQAERVRKSLERSFGER